MSDAGGDLAGRCALVTGGASGIGLACCELLVTEGAAVVIADRDADRGAQLAADLQARGHEAMFSVVDVTRHDECQAVVDAAVAWRGTLDIAVNAAGIAGPGDVRVADVSVEDWRSVLAVNLDGVFFSMRAELAAMARQGSGSIVNIASILGLVAPPPSGEQAAAYVASKHAVVGLTRSAAVEYASSGVRVNCVAPGYIQTPMLDGIDEAMMESLRSLHPIGRLGRAAEVAQAIVFLASGRASLITGSALVIDGGYTAC